MFSENPLKIYREFRGLTQEQLADKAGISKDYISKLEIGTREPSMKVIRDIAKALKVDVSHLVRN